MDVFEHKIVNICTNWKIKVVELRFMYKNSMAKTLIQTFKKQKTQQAGLSRATLEISSEFSSNFSNSKSI